MTIDLERRTNGWVADGYPVDVLAEETFTVLAGERVGLHTWIRMAESVTDRPGPATHARAEVNRILIRFVTARAEPYGINLRLHPHQPPRSFHDAETRPATHGSRASRRFSDGAEAPHSSRNT